MTAITQLIPATDWLAVFTDAPRQPTDGGGRCWRVPGDDFVSKRERFTCSIDVHGG